MTEACQARPKLTHAERIKLRVVMLIPQGEGCPASSAGSSEQPINSKVMLSNGKFMPAAGRSADKLAA